MDLRQYLRVFRAHWLGIVAIVLLATAVAFAWSLVQPRVYTADASAVVQAGSSTESTDVGSAIAGNSLAAGKVRTYIELGSSRSVAERVIEDLGLETSPQALVGRISISNPLETVSLRVSANGDTPESAQALAEAWVRAMTLEVNDFETENPNTQGPAYLRPIDSARLPTSPSSPNTRLILAIGALVGIALAVAYAVVRYTFDRRIRSVEAVERETGHSVVGTIPEEKTFTTDSRLIPFDGRNSSGSKNAHLFPIAEAMRELRTNIQFMDVDNPPRVMVVSSPLPGDGKSTTAANLAITLAAGGQKVYLIDGDLRRPMVANVFQLIEGGGLTDVLAGRASIHDVAQPRGAAGRLLVVGAGKVPPNPSEVLGSARMRELLKSLSNDAFVIVDAPPLIPVTDAAVIGNSADGVILVATVGRTTYEVLAKAIGNLDRAGARALGIVLNRVPRRGAGAAYYGYQYHGEYYRSGEPDGTAPEEAPAVKTPGPVRTGQVGPAPIAEPATNLATPHTPVARPTDGIEQGRRSRRSARE